MEYELARRDYETNRLLYDGLQERLEEASIMSGLHSTAIHPLDSADIPTGPSHPRTRFNMAAGAGVGFLLGLMHSLSFLRPWIRTSRPWPRSSKACNSLCSLQFLMWIQNICCLQASRSTP